MRKGSVLDLFFISSSVFAFAMVLVVSYFMLTQFQTGFEATAYSNTTAFAFSAGSVGFSAFNGGFLLVFMSFVLFTLISVYFIRTHPVFFVVNIFVLALLIIFSGTISNAYTEMFTDNALSTSANFFTYPALLLGNLPYAMIIISIVIVIIMFGKGYNASKV